MGGGRAKRVKAGGVAAAGGRDTVFMTREGFDPMGIERRPDKEACDAPGATFWDATSGHVPVAPQDIMLTDERDFVVGGQHRAERNPLRCWVPGPTGKAVSVGESPLGAEFDRHFSGCAESEKARLIEDKGGIRIERWVEPEHVKAGSAGRATLTPNSSKVCDHQDAATRGFALGSTPAWGRRATGRQRVGSTRGTTGCRSSPTNQGW